MQTFTRYEKGRHVLRIRRATASPTGSDGGDGRRFLIALAVVAAGALGLVVGTHAESQRAVTEEMYYYQSLRIVLYDTREALQFSIREAIGARDSQADPAGAALKTLPGKVRSIPPPPQLRGAHERLEDAIQITSDELAKAPLTGQGRIAAAVLAERRISELILLTELLERRDST